MFSGFRLITAPPRTSACSHAHRPRVTVRSYQDTRPRIFCSCERSEKPGQTPRALSVSPHGGFPASGLCLCGKEQLQVRVVKGPGPLCVRTSEATPPSPGVKPGFLCQGQSLFITFGGTVSPALWEAIFPTSDEEAVFPFSLCKFVQEEVGTMLPRVTLLAFVFASPLSLHFVYCQIF